MALPPFINSTGLIPKILTKIQEAKVPPRYTQDFQGTVLGYGSGSARPFIPFLKRLNFLQSDGTPTELDVTPSFPPAGIRAEPRCCA